MYISPEDAFAVGRAKGLREPALEDALALYDATAIGDESFQAFILRHKEDRAHWFMAPASSDAAPEEIYSVDAQTRFVKAGNSVLDLQDLLKRHGLKPGQVKPRPKEEAPDPTGEKNPWSLKFKGDAAARTAAQASIIKQGTKFATAMAKAAGVTIMGAPLPKK
jgi:hypothetical protein